MYTKTQIVLIKYDFTLEKKNPDCIRTCRYMVQCMSRQMVFFLTCYRINRQYYFNG